MSFFFPEKNSKCGKKSTNPSFSRSSREHSISKVGDICPDEFIQYDVTNLLNSNYKEQDKKMCNISHMPKHFCLLFIINISMVCTNLEKLVHSCNMISNFKI